MGFVARNVLFFFQMHQNALGGREV